tara:strand:+ start:12520 stop:14811 length:2292 start_codon:yes stop_codon:yes gene_type:complete
MNYSNNQMMYQRPMQGMANQLANQGRYGDSMMVHMNPVEVAGLASLSPTGSLTRNPMTGQPEAFLPFLAPLLGSAAGTALLPALSPALAGAIGSGVATTLQSGDLKQGIMSGLTGYGLGSAIGKGAEAVAGVPDAQAAVDVAKQGVEAATLDQLRINPQLDLEAAKTALGTSTPLPLGQPTGVLPPTTPFDANTGQILGTGAEGQLIKAQQIAEGKNIFSEGVLPEAAKAAIQPANLAMIGVGEGSRAQEQMLQDFEDQQNQMMQANEEKRLQAYSDMNRAKKLAAERYDRPFIPLNPNDNPYAGTYYGGGITSVDPSGYMRSRRNLENMGVEPLRMFAGGPFPVDYFNRLSGGASDTPSNVQDRIRPSRVVTEEELATEAADLVAQGKDPRAGFRSEIQYFREPLPDPEDPENPTPDPEPDPPFDPAPFVGYNPKGGMIPQGGRKGTNFYQEQQQNKTMPAGVTSGAMSSMAGLPQLMGLQGAQNLPMSTASPVESQTQDYSNLVMGDDSVTNLEEIRKRIAAMNLPFADGGKTDFPDYNKDGEITQADILMGRGVIEKQEGGRTEDGVMTTIIDEKGNELMEVIDKDGNVTYRKKTEEEIRRGSDDKRPASPLSMEFQEGGITSQDPLITATMQALMGRTSPEEMDGIIEAFVAKYGTEAFQELRTQVLQSIVPNAQTEGQIKGQGGGMEDNIDGMIGAEQPVAVSPNEYIVAADVVSGLGDGNSDAGAAALDDMMDRVRMTRTGTAQQPQPLDKRQVMPA